MEDVEMKGEVAAELMEDVKEDDGIGTTGDGDTDGLRCGGGEHLVTLDESGDFGGEIRGQQFHFTRERRREGVFCRAEAKEGRIVKEAVRGLIGERVPNGS